MGAEQFAHFSRGKTAKEAFDRAVEDALYDYGHSGYTGTIAEKSEFTMIEQESSVKTLNEAEEIANKLMELDDPRIDDKWGPAGCIKIKDGGFLFFGWASS